MGGWVWGQGMGAGYVGRVWGRVWEQGMGAWYGGAGHGGRVYGGQGCGKSELKGVGSLWESEEGRWETRFPRKLETGEMGKVFNVEYYFKRN